MCPFSIPYGNVNTAIYNAEVEAAHEDSKIHYIDTTNWGVEIGADGVHPTDNGHVTITNKLIQLLGQYLNQ